jgi:hypothetical protein
MLSCVVPVIAGCGASMTLTGEKSNTSTPGSGGATGSGATGGSGSEGGGSSEGPRVRSGTFMPHVRGIDGCLVCSGSTGPQEPSSVPASALAVSGIQALSDWQAATDTGGSSGSANGTMEIVGTPSLSGSAREFNTTYSNSGDERYDVSFGEDTQSTNFFYDGWVYLPSPSSDIANLEMDLNQVLANGQTVIFGFQCDGYSQTWDYTENAGTPQVPVDQWVHTAASCNPRSWTTDTWHHVQIGFSRDDSGNVTYNAVWLDGYEQALNVTAPSAFALGWASTLLTNFQVDGLGSGGSSTVYLDNLTVYRW